MPYSSWRMDDKTSVRMISLVKFFCFLGSSNPRFPLANPHAKSYVDASRISQWTDRLSHSTGMVSRYTTTTLPTPNFTVIGILHLNFCHIFLVFEFLSYFFSFLYTNILNNIQGCGLVVNKVERESWETSVQISA